MISLKIRLKTIINKPVDVNYNEFLLSLIQNYLDKKECKPPCHFILSPYVHRPEDDNEDNVSFSSFLCNNYNVIGNKIIFNDDVTWFIYCNSYNKMLKLVQGLYKLENISIGEAEFEIVSIEAKKSSKKRGSLIKNKVID